MTKIQEFVIRWFTFNIGFVNALNDHHTDLPSGKQWGWLKSPERAKLLAKAIIYRKIHLLGLNEMKRGKQQDALWEALGPMWSKHSIIDNVIAWDRSYFYSKFEGAIDLLYFGGASKRMPYVILGIRNKWLKNVEIAVACFHLPASSGDKPGKPKGKELREEDRERLAKWTAEQKALGRIVILLGDFNDKKHVILPWIRKIAGVRAAGVDKWWGIDWIMVDRKIKTVFFDSFRTNRLRRSTDHPLLKFRGRIRYRKAK